MKIGFTGTKMGMTVEQLHSFVDLIEKLEPTEFHHGDCVGADEEAHRLIEGNVCDIIIHPPINPSKRAFCKGYKEIRKEKEYLDRNHDIVDETERMIATPCSQFEVTRSGTWATIRYTRKTKKPIYIIWPNGKVELKE